MAVDNTFASPYVQQPIDFGADLVIHSTTKFLNGHSDSVGGAVIAVRDDHIEWLRFVQNAEGAILGPMDAWLVLRGTKTLPIRMERHNANAMALAEYLAVASEGDRGVLPRPAVASAARAGATADARLRRAHLVPAGLARAGAHGAQQRAPDVARGKSGRRRDAHQPPGHHDACLGAARASVSRLGITDDLVRVSVGIEDVDDLKDDLAQALDRVDGAS